MTGKRSSPLVPKLRFPEFQREADWKQNQIGKIASIFKGKGVSKADVTEDAATPCIRYAELYTRYGEVIHEVVSRTNVPHADLIFSQAEDVIVPASGETRADIARAACVLLEGVALGSDLNILRSDLYGPFLSYLLNSPLRYAIAQLAQGDTVAHLYPRQLSRVSLAYPSRPEQQKVADCLGSLDDLIAAEGRKLEALRQHKQGLMQQLFPQPGETRPRLRFPEFEDAPGWEERALGDVCEILNNRRVPITSSDRKPGPYPYYGASGIVDYVDDYIFDERLVLVGEDGAKWRAFEPTAFVAEGKYWVNNHAHVLRPHAMTDTLLANYLTMIDLAEFVTGAAPPKLTLGKLKTIPISLSPSDDEHQAIADCLSALDTIIGAQVARLDALRQHKQGLLQQLFPSLQEES